MNCYLCGAVIPIFFAVRWCDKCINEFLQQSEMTMEEFIHHKKVEAIFLGNPDEWNPQGIQE